MGGPLALEAIGLLREGAEEGGSVLGAEGCEAGEIGLGRRWQLVRGGRFPRFLHKTAEGALRGRHDHQGCGGVAADAESVGLGSRDEDEAVLAENCFFSPWKKVTSPSRT